MFAVSPFEREGERPFIRYLDIILPAFYHFSNEQLHQARRRLYGLPELKLRTAAKIRWGPNNHSIRCDEEHLERLQKAADERVHMATKGLLDVADSWITMRPVSGFTFDFGNHWFGGTAQPDANMVEIYLQPSVTRKRGKVTAMRVNIPDIKAEPNLITAVLTALALLQLDNPCAIELRGIHVSKLDFRYLTAFQQLQLLSVRFKPGDPHNCAQFRQLVRAFDIATVELQLDNSVLALPANWADGLEVQFKQLQSLRVVNWEHTAPFLSDEQLCLEKLRCLSFVGWTGFSEQMIADCVQRFPNLGMVCMENWKSTTTLKAAISAHWRPGMRAPAEPTANETLNTKKELKVRRFLPTDIFYKHDWQAAAPSDLVTFKLYNSQNSAISEAVNEN